MPALARAVALAGMLAACAGPSASGSTASPAGPAGSGSPLVGAWTSTVTKADLAAAGISDPNAQNENSGKFTITFGADGTWTQVQESLDGSPIVNPVFRGTYVVDGASLVMTTTFPHQYADSGLHYQWSITDAGLGLDLLDPPDPTLPVIMESHPWTRTS